jgi:catechol 2,3-dioxygenase-like lactoylglutathione lyase family enzyme
MAIEGLNHFTVLTENLDASIEFYGSVLGLAPGWRPPFTFPGAWLYCGSFPVLHLVAGRGVPDGPSVIDHVAFTAANLRETISTLKSRGVGYTLRRQPSTGEWQLFFHDPSGARVELDFPTSESAPEGA